MAENEQIECSNQQNRNNIKKSMRQRVGSLKKSTKRQTFIQTNQNAEREYPN